MIHTTHRRGSVCSAVLRTTDVDRAAAFYEALLPFTAEHVPGTDGTVRRLRFEGRTVAFIQQTPASNEWLPFVSVDDADATTATAVSLGASATDRVNVPGLARLVTLADTEAARFGLWQPAPVEGVELTELPGSLWWVEVLSDDPPRAREFYGALFGWSRRETAFEPFAAYTVFERDGMQEGGVLPIGQDWEVSPRWNV